jgi:hypothetical protein
VTSVSHSEAAQPDHVGDATFRDHQQQQVRHATLVDAVTAAQDLERLVRQGPIDNSDEAKQEHIALYALDAAAQVWLPFEPDLDKYVAHVGKVDGLGVDDLELRLQVILNCIRDAIEQTDPPSQPDPSERCIHRGQALVDAGAMAIALEAVKHVGLTAIELVKLWLKLPG